SVLAVELPSNVSSMHEAALIELGLLLFGITIVVNVLARVLIRRMGQVRCGSSLFSRLLRRRAPTAPETETPPPPRAPLPSNSRRAVLVNRLMIGGNARQTIGGLVILALLALAAVAISFLVPHPGLRTGLLTLVTIFAAGAVLATLGALGLCLVVTCVPL